MTGGSDTIRAAHAAIRPRSRRYSQGLAVVLALSALAVVTARPASAQEFPTSDPSYAAPNPELGQVREGFGAPGVIAISSDFDLSFFHNTESLNDQDQSTTSLRLAPNLQFFVADNVGVGGLFVLEYASSDPVSSVGLALGPSVSYNIPVGERSSLYPTLVLTYGWSKTTVDQAGGSQSASSNAFTLLIKVPFLFHPFPHVFVGFGPLIQLDLSAKTEGQDAPKRTLLGLTLDIGFWL